MKNYKSIFIYDKDDELTSYAELNKKSSEVVNQYFLKDRELTKSNTFMYGKSKETTKTKILFSEDCSLFYLNLDGESICRAVRKNSNSIAPPDEVSRVSLIDEKRLDSFSIKKNLIADWLKLL